MPVSCMGSDLPSFSPTSGIQQYAISICEGGVRLRNDAYIRATCEQELQQQRLRYAAADPMVGHNVTEGRPTVHNLKSSLRVSAPASNVSSLAYVGCQRSNLLLPCVQVAMAFPNFGKVSLVT